MRFVSNYKPNIYAVIPAILSNDILLFKTLFDEKILKFSYYITQYRIEISK